MKRLTIATTGRYEPKCFDYEGQEDATRPFVEYRLLTGAQVEAIRSQDDKESWARIWRTQVTKLEGVTFVVDGLEKKIPIEEVPDIPGTYFLYFEVASHILSESILGDESKKKSP